MHRVKDVNKYMSEKYKIQLGVDLNTSDIKDDIKKLDGRHKVKLGVDLAVNDIRDRIKQYNTNSNNIKVKLKATVDTDDIKKQIKALDLSAGIGKGVSVPVNTQSLEDALKEVKGIISSIQSSIGNVGDGSDFKPLLSSINQIGNALEKTSGKFEELTADLRALTSKDFNVNIGLKLGGNSVNNNAVYSDFVKDEVLPSLEKQERELRNYIAKHFNTNEIMGLNKLAGGELGGVAGIIETLDKLNTPLKKSESLKDKMRDYKNFINTIISSSKIQGIDLSPVLSQFDKLPNELIETADNIRDGVKQTDDAFDKLKQVFGGGNNFNVEGISEQLDSVVSDLNEIRTALQSLSSGNLLGGLTQSFDRLSSSIENLLTNAERVKGILGSTASSVGVGSTSDTKIKVENIMPDSNEVVQSAQQVGKKIGETVENAVEQSIDIDDVIDREVLGLMETFSIAGDRGSNAFKEIRQALLECRNDLQRIKDLDPGIDAESFDKSRAFDKVSDAIANQIREVNSLGNEYIELAKRIDNIDDVALAKYMKNFNDPKKGNKVRVPDFIKQEQGDDYRSTRGQLGNAFNTEKGISFASFIEDLNHELGIAIDLTKGEEKAYEELVHKVRLGREQLKEQEKSQSSLQANASTDEILAQNYINKNEIRDVAESSIDYINAAEAAERAFAQTSTQTANTVVQNEERKQQAHQQTSGVIENLKTTLETMRVDRSSIDTVVKDIEELGFVATDASVKMKNGKFDITVNGIDDVGRAITEIRRFDEHAQQKISLVERNISQPLVETDKFIKQQKKSVSDLTNQINQLNRAATDQNASRPIKKTDSLDALENKYQEIIAAIKKMGEASSSTFDEERNNVRTLISEYKSLRDELRNADNVSTKMKDTDFASGLDIAKNDLEKFKAQAKDFPQITQTIKSLDEAIENVGDASSLNKFNDQLRVARSELAKVKQETTAANRSEKVGINVSGLESKIADLQRISPEIDKFETEIDGAKVSVQSLLNDLKKVNTQGDFSVINSKFKAFTDSAKAAGIAVTDTVAKAKSALANDIKIDIELGNYENEMDSMIAKFNSLSDANTDLRESYEQTRIAYKAMLDASDTSTGDEIADRERLIQAEKEYATALEKTNNLIKIQARIDKANEDAQKLADKKTALQLDMANYLKDNSKAAKEFGGEIKRLSSLLDGLDDNVGVNKIAREFQNLQKRIKSVGKDGLTAFDKLKSKAKEYMTYLSAAEVFMYIEQGLRDMFEQVKVIDSAMTELKKVTNETDSAYNSFLSDAASKAKEIGTTIDGFVSSTADFARLGYNMSDASKLAEVANIYAVVGDEIDSVETATASLISTMTAFGIEASDSISIVDKFNIVGNNFAISSGGIGDALERSASSMAAANNSLDETIALITAANTVVQDADSVGTAFKTISMRIRGKVFVPIYNENYSLCYAI